MYLLVFTLKEGWGSWYWLDFNKILFWSDVYLLEGTNTSTNFDLVSCHNFFLA